MKYTATNPPPVCLMTQSTNYRDTDEIEVVGVLLHSTGANNPELRRYVQPDDDAPDAAEWLAKLGKNIYGNDYNHRSVQGGATGWLGRLADGSVSFVQTLPWQFRPWTCGKGKYGSCNGISQGGKKLGWIQFEICEDNLKDENYFDAIYRESCEVTAYLCRAFSLDPDGFVTINGIDVPAVTCHADAHKLGFASNHADVNHWFSRYGKTMDVFRDHVSELLTADTLSPLYRVQVGAFRNAVYAAMTVAKLKLLGYEAYTVSDGTYTRVQVGAFRKKSYAEHLKATLAAQGFVTVIKEALT